jgi:hypothetical protein
MTRFAALSCSIACALVACAAPTPGPTQPAVLYLENRGGPAFSVNIAGAEFATVSCASSTTLSPGQQNVPALPWDLTIVTVRDSSTILSTAVTELPRWFVYFREEANAGLSKQPVGGPAENCPPADTTSAPTPGTSPTRDPYAGLPSNACGGFHLKIVNDRTAPVRVTLNGDSSTVIGVQSTDTLVEAFLPTHPLLPWDVAVTDATTGQQLFRATLPGPVDQKVTLSDGGAVQTPFDLMTEGC